MDQLIDTMSLEQVMEFVGDDSPPSEIYEAIRLMDYYYEVWF